MTCSAKDGKNCENILRRTETMCVLHGTFSSSQKCRTPLRHSPLAMIPSIAVRVGNAPFQGFIFMNISSVATKPELKEQRESPSDCEMKLACRRKMAVIAQSVCELRRSDQNGESLALDGFQIIAGGTKVVQE